MPDDCLDLVGKVAALGWIELTGLMTIGPHTNDENRIRSAFALCRDLYRRGRDTVGGTFDTLSMGMTGDFPLAIAEGSTMIRVGTLLFGERQPWRESPS